MTIVKKTCDYCGNEFSGHHNTKFCSPECRLNHKRKYENEYFLRASLVKYPDGTDPYIFVECAICGLRSPDISGHVNKLHNITNEEYKLKYGKTKSQQLIDSVCGEKNPGYNHNGKFSPFSKNFINYESDEKIEQLVAKAAKSRVDNNNDTTKIEYYLSRGYSQEDAEIALSKRQSTFSLEKCIEKYGEIEGKKIWLERQSAWQNTLKSKPQEEIDRINRLKSTKINYSTLWSLDVESDGWIYLLKLDDSKIKIGITSKNKLSKRYDKQDLMNTEVLLFEKATDINHAFMIEQYIKTEYLEHIKPGEYGVFGWTEVIHIQDMDEIKNLVLSLLKDKDYTHNKFKYG
jgi:hypothetical protein